MNNRAEQLWNYIDGTCTPEEHAAISRLIATDDVYRTDYEELLAINQEFAAIELDEPPMAFTYHVMEAIRTEASLVPLKASIDQRIIKGIAVFFGLTILALLAFTLFSMKWTGANTSLKLPDTFKLPDLSLNSLPQFNLKQLFGNGIMQGFLFFDMVFGLYLFDSWLRKSNHAKQA